MRLYSTLEEIRARNTRYLKRKPSHYEDLAPTNAAQAAYDRADLVQMLDELHMMLARERSQPAERARLERELADQQRRVNELLDENRRLSAEVDRLRRPQHEPDMQPAEAPW